MGVHHFGTSGWTRALRLAAVAGALTLAAACGSSGGGASSGASGDVVRSANRGGVDGVLIDKSGHTLYAADQESGGTIKCQGGCVEIWQPLTVSKGTKLSSDGTLSSSLATKARPDGKLQVTFKGYPLYTFAEDGSAKDMKGNAVSDSFGGTSFSWHTMTGSGLAPSGKPSKSSGGGGGGYGY